MSSVTFTLVGEPAIETLRSVLGDSSGLANGRRIVAPSSGWVASLGQHDITAATVHDTIISLAGPILAEAGQRVGRRSEHKAAIARVLAVGRPSGWQAPEQLVAGLADLHDDLAGLDAAGWQRLAAQPPTTSGINVVDTLRRATLEMGDARPWSRIVDYAIEVVEERCDDEFVLFLPDGADPATGRLLAALTATKPATVILVGLSASPTDDWHLATLNGWARLGGPENPARPASHETPDQANGAAVEAMTVAGFDGLVRLVRGLCIQHRAASVAVMHRDGWPGATRLEPLRAFGRVTVGSLGELAGTSFDHVLVVEDGIVEGGIVEGWAPATEGAVPIDTGLFDDQARVATGGAVAPIRTGLLRHRHRVASALAGAKDKSWQIKLGKAGAPVGAPATLDQVVFASMAAHLDDGGLAGTHEAALGVAGEGIAKRLERIAQLGPEVGLTPFTGAVPAGLVDLATRPVSATGLESYARCPRRYLFERVLRIEDHVPASSVSGTVDEISPRDRGTLIHEVLHLFLREQISAHNIPDPGQEWHSDAEAHLFDIARSTVTQWQEWGATGNRAATETLAGTIQTEVASWLRFDTRLRAERRSWPVAAELSFGFDEPPVRLELGNGSVVHLRGIIDRVDRTEDGGVLVIDYKTGTARSFFSGSVFDPQAGVFAPLPDSFDPLEGGVDPLDRGRQLQLPLYAMAAAQVLGLTGPKSGLYWFTASSVLQELRMDERLWAHFDQVAGELAEGIEAGAFPATPGPATGQRWEAFENCRFCAFDQICSSGKGRSE